MVSARSLRLRIVVGLSASLLTAAIASPAHAGTLSSSAVGCDGYTLARPFLRWLDPAQYTRAPNGGLENSSTEWTLTGGAQVVAGNEPYKVGGTSDAYSLYLPSGASATTRSMCVGLLDPTLRFFVSNRGSVLSTLKVEVMYENAFGQVKAQTVARVAGTAAWAPTLPIAFLANVTGPLSLDGLTTAVAFRFTASGPWRLDDVYVDPFKVL